MHVFLCCEGQEHSETCKQAYNTNDVSNVLLTYSMHSLQKHDESQTLRNVTCSRAVVALFSISGELQLIASVEGPISAM